MKYFDFRFNVLHIFYTADTRLHIMRCNSNKVVRATTDVHTAGVYNVEQNLYRATRWIRCVAHVSIMLGTFWCKLQMTTKTAYLYTNKWQFFVYSLHPAHSVSKKTNSHMPFHTNVLLGSVPITNDCDNDVTTTNSNILCLVTCHTFSVSAGFQPFAYGTAFILKSVLAHICFLFFMHVASIYYNYFVHISGMKNLYFLQLFYRSPLLQNYSYM